MAATYSDDVPEQEGTGVESGDVGYRGQSDVHLTKRDLEDAEFFGALAAHFVLLGVKPTIAWERALEWIRENPDDLPAGFEWPPAAAKASSTSTSPKREFVTPHARLTEQLEDVERFVPKRERGSSVSVGLVEDDDQELALDEQDGPKCFAPHALPAAAHHPAALRPKSRTSTTPARLLCLAWGTRELRTDALSPEKGTVMARGDMQKALFKAILSGPKTTADLIALKLTTPGSTMATLTTLKKKGAIANDGQGEPWRIVNGGGFEAWLEKRNEEREKTNGHSKPKSIEDIAKKHARKPARRASARESPPPAAPVAATTPAPGGGLADAFETMRAALKADFERKMAALDILAGK